MKVVIPAAGAGKRFLAEGVTTPKELLPLGGKPLIAHALSEAARAGFESAVVVVSPTKHGLIRFLGHTNHPLSVEVVAQPEPLGIGDAVLRCWQYETLGVLLPDDVVLETGHWTDLLELHQRTGAAALCVRPVPIETTSRFGIAECDGDRVTNLFEKPTAGRTTSNLAVFGRYLVTDTVVAGLKRHHRNAELELTSGFAAAIETHDGVRAVLFEGRAFDCGTPTDYAASIRDFTGR